MQDQNNSPDCTDKEHYALQVLGDSMEPEFEDGNIIIVDPGYPLYDGAYVVADYAGDTALRQYVEQGERKFLIPLNNHYPTWELIGPYNIRGVVTQCNRGRRDIKHFV